MTNLYKKSELLFSLVLIIVYVAGTGLADSLSDTLGTVKSVTAVFHGAFSAVLFLWLRRSDLFAKYGLCKSSTKASRYLYYVPLIIVSTVNLWFGVRLNMPITETILFLCSMFFVGFLEEIIFRGFLFRAMEKDGVRSAVVVSSLTFGIGHIVNLFNGHVMGLIENLCQIAYAVAFGFMFVLIFHKGGSLIPCIISHSTVNMLSAFANEDALTDSVNIVLSLCLCVFIGVYCMVLHRLLPRGGGGSCSG